jgi:CNT family concentrative nucleoside transporter
MLGRGDRAGGTLMFALENAQSLLGIFAIVALCWALSERRGAFPWKLALGVVVAQAVLILILFALPASRVALNGATAAVNALASSTQAGVKFVFGFLAGTPDNQPYAVDNPQGLFVFAFRVLPVIVVVCGLSALLWHWRILQWVTRGFGLVFERAMGLGGAPALAVAATMFMGQVEGPIFIRTYLKSLSRADLFMLLTVGMTCVAGSTVVAYVTILATSVPNAAAHVLTASVISAPAGVLLARILVPRAPDEEADRAIDLRRIKEYTGSIDALMRGTSDGLQIALNIGAILIVLVALITMVNGILGMAPRVGAAPLSVQGILGWIFSPLAFLMGVPWREAPAAGALLGDKLVLTEFTAFADLSSGAHGAIGERARVIMTYALCGFANIGSVGINVAGYSILVPERRAEVVSMVWKAMLAGFLATCMTASVVGALPGGLLTF